MNYEHPQGWIDDPVGVERFLHSLPQPLFRDAAPHLLAARRYGDEAGLLYRSLLELMPDWKPHRQTIGDCVSHGWGLAIDTLAAVQIVLDNRPETWHGETATEVIYGGSRVEALGKTRGGWSDGSNGAWAARWVQQWGVLVRRSYGAGELDLQIYDGQKAKQWGNYGVPDSLEPLARAHPVRQVALVETFDQAVAALRSGYPIPVCCGLGFSSRRDADGFAPLSGSWAHCQLIWGYRLGRRPGLLWQNSWADWNSGPKWPLDMPAGGYWVDAEINERAFRDRDTFAISNLLGYPPRRLDFARMAGA